MKDNMNLRVSVSPISSNRNNLGVKVMGLDSILSIKAMNQEKTKGECLNSKKKKQELDI